MQTGQKLWTRQELMLAINLYCKLSFGQLDRKTKEVIELATMLDRTPSAVAWKLNNFASFDPKLQARGIKGATNASKLDKKIWDEFFGDWDDAYLKSELELAKAKNTTIEKLNHIDFKVGEGIEKERIVKTRLNQSIFRKLILVTYKSTCCISQINTPELLIASHIVPWSVDKKNRLNPMNGLCLNALLDKAFDIGMLTVSADDYKVVLSTKLKRNSSPSVHDSFLQYEGKEIQLPEKFLPAKDFLKIHNNFFISKN